MTQMTSSPPGQKGATASDARRRLRILQVAIVAVGLTVAVRLIWVQTADSAQYQARAEAAQTHMVTVPAARGDILDANGEILAGNRSTYEVRIKSGTDQQVLDEVSRLAGVPASELAARMVVCGQPGSQPGTCYRSEPGQPIPVLTDAGVQQALAVRQADLTGVSVERVAVRDYPSQANAAQLLGYTADGKGKSGLEAQYDSDLQGVAGKARRTASRDGSSSEDVVEPVAGQTLVTSLDVNTQVVAEQALKSAVEKARSQGYRATGGSVVVMDVHSGAVRAMASYPSYDPNIWAHGVSDAQYARLTDEKGGRPLILRPTQGLAPPASTFKSLTTAAAAAAGFDLNGTYSCPASVSVGGQIFRNYDSRAFGPMSLAKALSMSCDTVFYRLGYSMWKRDGGLQADGAREDVAKTARSFGLGATTGVDVPGELSGSMPDRAQVRAEYEERKDAYCQRAKQGYPEEPDPARARLLKAYARDYCRSGDEYKAGDAMNTAIGQGRTLVTPLQMAVAYAAIANGGTVVTPHVGTELRGATTTDIEPAPKGTVDADPATLAFLRTALADTTVNGTAAGAFSGFPLDEIPVAGKTGTAEVAGKQSTSWFASFAPADDPQYVVVVNVDQGGYGAATSGPVARAVYEQIFGVSTP